MDKTQDAFRTIGEVAEELDLPQHVLRFWETKFPQIRPVKRAGGRRYYRPEDIQLVSAIRVLLYGEGYTIRGVQRLLKEQGGRALVGAARGGARPSPRESALAPPERELTLAPPARELDFAPPAREKDGPASDLFAAAASLRLPAAVGAPFASARLSPRRRALLEQALDELETGARRLSEGLNG